MRSLNKEFFSTIGLHLIKRLSSITHPSHSSYLVKNISNDDLVLESLYLVKCDSDSHGTLSCFAFNAITSSKANGKFLQSAKKIISSGAHSLSIYEYLPFSLANLHDKKVTLDHTQILKIIGDIIASLEFLGQKHINVSHNNLKLENILCDNTDIEKANIYLSDLHIDKQGYSLQSASGDLATIGYLIPKLLSPNSAIHTLGEAQVFFDNPSVEEEKSFASLRALTLTLIDTSQHQYAKLADRLFTEIIPPSIRSINGPPEPVKPEGQFLELLVDDTPLSQSPHILGDYDVDASIKIPNISKLRLESDLSPLERLNFMLLHYNQEGSSHILYEMACLILKEPIEGHAKLCISYLEQLVETNHAGACNLLAQCYLSGYIAPKNEHLAIQLFTKGLSCDPDAVTKQNLADNLALCYQHGIGTHINKKKAKAPLSF